LNNIYYTLIDFCYDLYENQLNNIAHPEILYMLSEDPIFRIYFKQALFIVHENQGDIEGATRQWREWCNLAQSFQ